MTKVEQLRSGRSARLDRLEEMWAAVTRWRTAECARPDRFRAWAEGGPALRDVSVCVGDNHLADCPVELARQDVIAVHNKGLP